MVLQYSWIHGVKGRAAAAGWLDVPTCYYIVLYVVFGLVVGKYIQYEKKGM